MPRLDQYIASNTKIKRKDVKALLAQGRVMVDQAPAADGARIIDKFSHIRLDGKILQAKERRYLMLNKPHGVVSATRDKKHDTVIDLLEQPYRDQLHIVGRLDFNSTGLMLLTNDGRWSKHLSLPQNKLLKRYRVGLEKPLSNDYVIAFREGMKFDYEGLTTSPAELTIVSDFVAEVGLLEGRYHQLKRMFGRFDNKVLSIHRFAVGPLLLDDTLAPGQSRELTPAEISLTSTQ